VAWPSSLAPLCVNCNLLAQVPYWRDGFSITNWIQLTAVVKNFLNCLIMQSISNNNSRIIQGDNPLFLMTDHFFSMTEIERFNYLLITIDLRLMWRGWSLVKFFIFFWTIFEILYNVKKTIICSSEKSLHRLDWSDDR